MDQHLLVRLDRVAGKLDTIAGLPEQPGIFGAGTHRFLVGPPVSERVVADFEHRHDITLPADYRAFLTLIGHAEPRNWGGAGPFYGLVGLNGWDMSSWLDEGWSDTETNDDALATAFRVAPGQQIEGSWTAALGLAEGDEWFPGQVALSMCGCGDMAVLVVTGPGRGRVAYTASASQAPQYPADPDFLAWYERWLDCVLAGEDSFF
jgi:hypothetical protein